MTQRSPGKLQDAPKSDTINQKVKMYRVFWPRLADRGRLVNFVPALVVDQISTSESAAYSELQK